MDPDLNKQYFNGLLLAFQVALGSIVNPMSQSTQKATLRLVAGNASANAKINEKELCGTEVY